MQEKLKKLTRSRDLAEASMLAAETKVKEIASKITYLENEVELSGQCAALFSKLVDARVSDVKGQIEKIVNEGLRVVFGGDTRIEIVSSVKRGKTEFEIQVISKGVTGGVNTFGGGVLAVIAFLLKIIVIIVTKKNRLMISDESLTFVSIQYQERLSAFIRKLCDTLEFDIILISHQPVLTTSANRVYTAYEKQDGSTGFKLEQ